MILSLQLLIVFCNKQEKNNVRSGGNHLKPTHTAIFRDRILVRMEHIQDLRSYTTYRGKGALRYALPTLHIEALRKS